MISENQSLLQRMKAADNGLDPRVSEILLDERTEKISSSTSPGCTVEETLAIWRTRNSNSKITNHTLYGLAPLLANLESIDDPETRVRQIGFDAERFICMCFFVASSDRFLGYVLSEKRTEEEEKIRLASFNSWAGVASIPQSSATDTRTRNDHAA